MNTLQHEMDRRFGSETIADRAVPAIIASNLNPSLPLRPYQNAAFRYLDTYWTKIGRASNSKSPHLLFRMATGSGKTMVMAGAILFLYEQGYRNFVFFVNSTNIIEKTRANFLASGSPKYLFNHIIASDGRVLRLREVQNFAKGHGNGEINIMFTTVQGLHEALRSPKEGGLSDSDFDEPPVVLLSDEAHHLNADTKKGKSAKSSDSWESTVNRIHKLNVGNVLLEFTATMDMDSLAIREKYADKLLFDYSLKEFRTDGYSKDIKVMQCDMDMMDRAIIAVVLNQYRLKIFQRNGVSAKPTILFKSKKIDESADFRRAFSVEMAKLTGNRLQRLLAEVDHPVFHKVRTYLESNAITFENFAREISEDFREERLISVNSREESELGQLLVNNLESNDIRAVFAVDKLNEGWDVLNLFDIVRLYDTRDGNGEKVGPTTMSEAQLIGRGARYFPFRIEASQELFKRKYDRDIDNELRICEELFYHSKTNPKYISELTIALQKQGLIAKSRREIAVRLKDSFKKSELYRNGVLFVNEREEQDRRIADLLALTESQRMFSVSIATGISTSHNVFSEVNPAFTPSVSVDVSVRDFSPNVVRAALQRIPFYHFEAISTRFLSLTSLNEFIRSDRFLGSLVIEVKGLSGSIGDLDRSTQLDIAVRVLLELRTRISTIQTVYRGSKSFQPREISKVFGDRVLTVEDGTDAEHGRPMSLATDTNIYFDVAGADWFAFNECFGTSEEKHLVRFLAKRIEQLGQSFSDIHLVRNERHFQLFSFDEGRAFEPDFVMFLGSSNGSRQYQFFIEPKGEHLIEYDRWKQEFLIQIREHVSLDLVAEGKDFIVWGLPFFNSTTPAIFSRQLEEALGAEAVIKG
jgi:type III restriction enzyme